MSRIGYPNPINITTDNEWLKEGYGTDPLESYTKFACIALMFLVSQTWFYSYIKLAPKFCRKALKRICRSEPLPCTTSEPKINDKFEETKSNILGTSQTVLMIVLAIIAILPVTRAKVLMKKNIADINHCYLRNLCYLAKISMPTFTFLIFPLLMLTFNHRVRKSLIKELKETSLGKKLCGLVA